MKGLGRHRPTMKRQLFASIVNMTTEERSELHREMENCNKVQTKVESCNEAPPHVVRSPPPSAEHEAESQGVWI